MTGNSLPSQPASRVLRVAVAGASGRMGRMLIEALRASDDMVLAGALDVAASPAIGSDATAFLGVASGVPITADLRQGLPEGEFFGVIAQLPGASGAVSARASTAGAGSASVARRKSPMVSGSSARRARHGARPVRLKRFPPQTASCHALIPAICNGLSASPCSAPPRN